MNPEISLVEVVMQKYKKGDKEYSDFINEVLLVPAIKLCTKELEEYLAIKEKAKKDKSPAIHLLGEGDIIFTKDATAFKFNAIGQSLELSYSGGIEFVLDELGWEEFLDGWTDSLVKIGNLFLKAYKDKGLKTNNVIRFITVWEYCFWKDYYGEYDDEWQLMGHLDLDDKDEFRKMVKSL